MLSESKTLLIRVKLKNILHENGLTFEQFSRVNILKCFVPRLIIYAWSGIVSRTLVSLWWFVTAFQLSEVAVIGNIKLELMIIPWEQARLRFKRVKNIIKLNDFHVVCLYQGIKCDLWLSWWWSNYDKILWTLCKGLM